MIRFRLRWHFIIILLIIQVIFGFYYLNKQPPTGENYFQKYVLGEKDNVFHLTDRNYNKFFKWFDDDLCLVEGTILEESKPGLCKCKSEWKGKRCGMPKFMTNISWTRNATLYSNLQVRTKPRRLIFIVNFNYDFSAFEIFIKESGDIVDAYLIGEVQHSPKYLNKNHSLYEKLKNGWLSEYQSKFIYVPISENAIENESAHQILIDSGLKLISDVRPDDLILFSNGNEIFKRSVLIFLKIFRNYPLPIQCEFSHYIYGFFYKMHLEQTNICGISFHLIANAFEYKLSRLESGTIYKDDQIFFEESDQPILSWVIPSSGWKCHNCLLADQLFEKILQLPLNTQPRWFRNQTDIMVPYFRRLIKYGQDINNLNLVGVPNTSDRDLPMHLLNNRITFSHLINNPYSLTEINLIQEGITISPLDYDLGFEN